MSKITAVANERIVLLQYVTVLITWTLRASTISDLVTTSHILEGAVPASDSEA